MKDSVIIKSNAKGITLVLDEELDFETLIRDICVKFAKSRDFFGEAELCLSIENRAVTAEEAAMIVEAVELNSEISILLIEENHILKNKEMLGKIDKFFYENISENAKIIIGTIRGGESIGSDTSLVIVGDVKKGSEVHAAGNVLIFGTLSGEATAQMNSKTPCYVLAQEFVDAHVTVAEESGTFSSAHKKSLRSMRKSAGYAVCNWKGALVCEPISSGVLKQFR